MLGAWYGSQGEDGGGWKSGNPAKNSAGFPLSHRPDDYD